MSETTEKTQPTIGRIIDAGFNRDAIHIAVAPVQAMEELEAGAWVELLPGSTTQVVRAEHSQHGIIDPFLEWRVRPDEWCWMFLPPNTITNLRHEWTHPAFEREAARGKADQAVRVRSLDTEDRDPAEVWKRAESEVWLRDFAPFVAMTYTELMKAAANFLDSGEDYVLPFNNPEQTWDKPTMRKFWEHHEKVTGRGYRGEDPGFFSCSC